MSATFAIAMVSVVLFVVAALLLGPARSDEAPVVTLAGFLCVVFGLIALVIAAVRAGATP